MSGLVRDGDVERIGSWAWETRAMTSRKLLIRVLAAPG